ncbi:hypothetical protein K1719_017991 [Acacia pycnantha]|nr:hypothetical protein K1719_017991 [Acacia pycnantha]
MIEESLQKQEKHIAVDPLSLKQQEPAIVPPPLQPLKSKFLSCQPISPTSSPHFTSILSKKKSKVDSLKSLPCPAQSHLHKSKLCGEGRTHPPSDEFDLWSVIKHDSTNIHHYDLGSFMSRFNPSNISIFLSLEKE